MEIKTAEFTLSAPRESLCPNDNKIEFAFIGRSNVGKSSLINMLCNNKKLAKTSATPGKTLLINHFIINREWYLVDLPGYGYAAVSKSERAAWGRLIEYYFAHRENLALCMLLLDIRRVPNDDDMKMIAAMQSRNVPLIAVLTKSDKLSNNEKAKQIKIISEKTGISKENLIVFSAALIRAEVIKGIGSSRFLIL